MIRNMISQKSKSQMNLLKLLKRNVSNSKDKLINNDIFLPIFIVFNFLITFYKIINIIMKDQKRILREF